MQESYYNSYYKTGWERQSARDTRAPEPIALLDKRADPSVSKCGRRTDITQMG
jgi:hypothetical protein